MLTLRIACKIWGEVYSVWDWMKGFFYCSLFFDHAFFFSQKQNKKKEHQKNLARP